MRKVIQISAIGGEMTDTVYALCDDGSIFYHYNHSQHGERWIELTPIPQTEAHKGESE